MTKYSDVLETQITQISMSYLVTMGMNLYFLKGFAADDVYRGLSIQEIWHV